jgi:hypothetical protein
MYPDTLFANNTHDVGVLKADAKPSHKLAKDTKNSLDNVHARFSELKKLVAPVTRLWMST